MMDEKRFRSEPTRSTRGGQVHRYIWDRRSQVWHVACRSAGTEVNGEEVDPTEQNTCLRCARWNGK